MVDSWCDRYDDWFLNGILARLMYRILYEVVSFGIYSL